MKKGLIQVYTGDGKGKTTASIGQAIRAIGNGLKVCFVYFHKDPERWGYGELKVLEDLGVEIFGFAKRHPHFYKETKFEEMRRECLEGLDFIKGIFSKKRYEVLILDEILIALRDGFIKEEELLEILKKRPEGMELILTGRCATKNLIKIADLVSEVKKIKHPYDKGAKSRKGFDY